VTYTVPVLLLAALGQATPPAVSAAATPLDWWLLALYLALALGVSFLCSMLEAGILSLPVSHVRVMAEEDRLGGRRLVAMKNNLDRPLAAILTLNTIAHTIGAAGVGAQILVIFGSEAVAIGSAIVTLLILVISEIIPKSLGAAHAKALVPFTALTIHGMILLTLPLVIPLQWLSNRLRGQAEHIVTRDEVAVTAELGRMAGQLDTAESRVIRNLLGMRQIPVGDIMTPRTVIFMLRRDLTVGQVLERHPRLRFSRIPVFADDPDDIAGHVTRYDVQTAHNTGHDERTLADLAKPLTRVHEDQSVAATMERMVAEHQHILLVADQFGATAGLVTQEDCIETLLGVEIVDETDSVEDMREAARRLLAQRRALRDTDEGEGD